MFNQQNVDPFRSLPSENQNVINGSSEIILS